MLDKVPLQALCLLFEELQTYGSSLVTPRSLPLKSGTSTGGGKPQQERRSALEHLVAHHVNAADQVSPPPPPPPTPTTTISPTCLRMTVVSVTKTSPSRFRRKYRRLLSITEAYYGAG
jgi:hypothetical protein